MSGLTLGKADLEAGLGDWYKLEDTQKGNQNQSCFIVCCYVSVFRQLVNEILDLSVVAACLWRKAVCYR